MLTPRDQKPDLRLTPTEIAAFANALQELVLTLEALQRGPADGCRRCGEVQIAGSRVLTAARDVTLCLSSWRRG